MALMLLSMGVRAASASPNTVWTVNDPADPPALGDGKCQLREAIALANGGVPNFDCPPGSTSYSTNVISINLAGGGYQAITLAAELPHIVRPVFIDASAEAGGPPPMVGLIGQGINAFDCLTFDPGSAGSRLVGLRVVNCMNGVNLKDNGVTLQRNWFGAINETTVMPDQFGVRVQSSNNRIGLLDSTYPDMPSNVFSSSGESTTAEAIIFYHNLVHSRYTGNVVQSNYIGPLPDGMSWNADIINRGTGIVVACGEDGATIGGALPHQGNVISGWSSDIRIYCSANHTHIYGNKIGTDATGMPAPNPDGVGIYVDLPSDSAITDIGGAMPTHTNLIDTTFGMVLGTHTAGNGTVSVDGNIFGMDSTGGPSSNSYDIWTYAPGRYKIQNNLIAGSTGAGLHVFGGDLAGSTGNCFTWNDQAVDNYGPFVDLRFNWWGDATGPSNEADNPGGLGELIGDWINFDPWLHTMPLSCDGFAPHRNAPIEHSFRLPIGGASPIQWSPVPTASGYHLTVADNGGLLNPIADMDLKTTSAKVGPLGYGEWFWQTTTYTVNRFAWKSQLHTFYVTIQKAPKPQATVKAGTVKFSWAKYQPTPFDYSFQLYGDGKCGTPSGSPASVTGVSTTVSLTPGMYSWQVTPKGGPSMPCWIFTVK